MLGNEAIARGLVEAGCQFISAYPGTPSSEILPAVVQFKEELGLPIYAEWSTNEKVALETGLAAAYSGKRTAVVMKQVGLNVAADPALSSAYIGVLGGLVLVVADDPGPQSSQTEQDSRLFALFAKIPALDPASAQEAKEMAAPAFELSERHQIPVMLRPTTRICHAKQVIACGPVAAAYHAANFVKNPRRWAATPRARNQLHQLLNQKLAAIENEFESWPGNQASFIDAGRAPLGIVACGVSYAILMDLLEPLGLAGHVSVLKIATAYPLPRTLVGDFAARCERILVLEELDVAVETQIRVATPVWGRLTGHVPCHGELTPEAIEQVLLRAASEAGLETRNRHNLALRDAVATLELPVRRPTLCAGCGHRSAFYAMRRSFPDAIFPGDIGCYTLGLNLGGVDTVHDMGASITMAAGFYHAYAQDGEVPPIFATIGDGTFFHSGAAGLENAVCNGAKFVLVVLDNSTTGMTGMQPTPECGGTADGHHGRPVILETLIRGCGIDYIATANPYDLPVFQSALAEAHEHTRGKHGGVAVVIARYACVNQMKGLGPDKQATPVIVKHALPRAFEAAAMDPQPCLPRHENKVSPCCVGCPSGNDVERLMTLVGAGRFEAAAHLLYQEHPFPSTLGRVCPQPCESACNRRDYDGAVSIRAIERVAGDAGRSAATVAVAGPARGHAVAVVGGGPAGLTAAYHLARLGYAVEIFEAREAAGGLLRWGIPEFRLPAAVLGREMEVFDALGVKIHLNARIGENLPWAALDRFDAICVSIGAWRERRLNVAGEERAGVFAGMEFLRLLRLGQQPALGQQIAVIGGGNTAVDVARSARRLGAEVAIYSAENGMSAIHEEVVAAQEEGIHFHFNLLQTMIAAGTERKLALHLREVKDWRPDLVATPIGNAIEVITEVDSIVVAIGAVAGVAELNASGLAAAAGLAVDAWGRTASPRLFAAGDATSRAAGTVTGAVNAGKRAALAIHAELGGAALALDELRLLQGPGIAAELLHRAGVSSRSGLARLAASVEQIKLHGFPQVARSESRHRSAEEALWGFEEVELGISPEMAAAEAQQRCFHCGVCTDCDICLKVCPTGAIGQGAQGGYTVDAAKCTGCRLCQTECPRSAITMPALQVCVACGYCTTWFECPSIVRRADGQVDIDRRTCVDCGMCTQVCAQGAIQYAPALAVLA